MNLSLNVSKISVGIQTYFQQKAIQAGESALISQGQSTLNFYIVHYGLPAVVIVIALICVFVGLTGKQVSKILVAIGGILIIVAVALFLISLFIPI